MGRARGYVVELVMPKSAVASLVDALEARHQGLRDRLYDGEGELRSYVRVFVNEEDVRFLEGKKTALKSGDTVAIVPAIAGGVPRRGQVLNWRIRMPQFKT